jgi:hypothetical protein
MSLFRLTFFALIASICLATNISAQSGVSDMRAIINAGVTYTKVRTVSIRIEAVGAVSMIVGNDSTFRGAAWQKYMTIMPQWILTEGEGDKFVYVKCKDAKGKESPVFSDKIVLDKTPPENSSIEIDVPEGIVKDAMKLVKLKIKSDGATYMMIANQKDFKTSKWEIYKTEVEWKLDAENDGIKDGLKQVFIKFRDKGGNISEVSFATIMVDTQLPVDEKMTINNGKNVTTVADIQLTLFVRGGIEMQISESPDFAGVEWVAYEPAQKWKLTKQGKTKLYAKFRDDANNESAVTSAEILFDNTPPTECSIEIENGAEKNSHPDRLTKLKIVAKDAHQMIVSNSLDFFGCNWMPFSEIMMWKLASGINGERTVYIRFRDVHGNETAIFSDKILYERK